MDFATQVQQCSPTVHLDTMRRIVQVESAFNPYAIGVVGARLQRQPRSQAEALATIRWLDANGYNYSVGLAQVNKNNFSAHGLTAETALIPCQNLRAGGAILTACFARASKSTVVAQVALRAAFSCYESGNFITGLRDGYVRKIVGAGPLMVATQERGIDSHGTTPQCQEMTQSSRTAKMKSSTKCDGPSSSEDH